MLLIAAEHPFRHIYGVEFALELHRKAEANKGARRRCWSRAVSLPSVRVSPPRLLRVPSVASPKRSAYGLAGLPTKGTRGKGNHNRKRDTSIELRKGTFLARLDNFAPLA